MLQNVLTQIEHGQTMRSTQTFHYILSFSTSFFSSINGPRKPNHSKWRIFLRQRYFHRAFFFLSLLISSIVDNTEPMALPPAPCVNEFDSGKHESNEEFIARLKHMGKSRLTLIFVNKIRWFYFSKASMDKFNQLARRFSIRKDSKQPM